MRCSTRQLDAVLREALGAFAVDPEGVRPHLSILGGKDDGPVQRKHTLYRASEAILHTRSRGRVIRAAIAALGLVGREPPPGTHPFRALVAERDGSGYVLHTDFRRQLEQALPRLARRGWRVADAPVVWLNTDAAEVVVPEVGLAIDDKVLDAVGADSSTTERALPYGAQMPVCSVIVPQRGEDSHDTPAQRMLAAVSMLPNPHGRLTRRATEACRGFALGFSSMAWTWRHPRDDVYGFLTGAGDP